MPAVCYLPEYFREEMGLSQELEGFADRNSALWPADKEDMLDLGRNLKTKE